MNTNKLKLSWNGSDWTQSIEGDTGTSIALFTTTTTNLLSVLTMAGFAVSQVVLENTSTLSLDMKYAPDIAKKQHEKLASNEIGQICGSVSTHWNPMSREWTTTTSTNSGGDGFLVDSECLQESLYRISTTIEDEWNSFRCDTMTQAQIIADSLSHQVVDQEFMGWRW